MTCSRKHLRLKLTLMMAAQGKDCTRQPFSNTDTPLLFTPIVIVRPNAS